MELYPRPVHDAYRRRTLRYSEAVDRACEAIRRATDGLGTDEATLIRELTPLSPHDRALVVFRYKDLYREQVKDTLRRELAGDYRVLLLLMIMSPPEADAFLLHMAATRWRTKEKFISTILLGRTNEELSILRATYADLFNQDLTRMMKEELSGDLRTIAVLALEVQQQASIASGYSELTCNVGYDPVSQRLQEDFDPAVHTIERAQEDADALYKAGEGRWGTDEDTFIKILFRSPREHLVQLNDVYRKKYRSDLEAAVRCEFSGYATEALLHYVRITLKPIATLARHFESTMKGLGTDEKRLSAAVIRYQLALQSISDEYKKIYGRTLESRIESDTSGDYGALLLALLGVKAKADPDSDLASELESDPTAASPPSP